MADHNGGLADSLSAFKDKVVYIDRQSVIRTVRRYFPPLQNIDAQSCVEAGQHRTGFGGQVPDVGFLDRRRDYQQGWTISLLPIIAELHTRPLQHESRRRFSSREPQVEHATVPTPQLIGCDEAHEFAR